MADPTPHTPDPAGLATLLDGKRIAREVRTELAAQLASLAARGVHPRLIFLRVGNDPASEVYVSAKRRAARSIGLQAEERHLPEDIGAAQLGALIDELNADPHVDGILLQLPLPPHLEPQRFLERIDPLKDVDGFHPLNVGRMVTSNDAALVPATPRGVLELLHRSGISVHGLDAVVIGRSNIVGKPMSILLDKADCTVTLCHTETRDLAANVRRADLLVVATGHAELVHGDWLKPGAIVVDVGMTRRPDGSLVGDVHFESARRRAAFITPVPGGVGPMTVAMVLEQTLVAARLRRGLNTAAELRAVRARHPDPTSPGALA